MGSLQVVIDILVDKIRRLDKARHATAIKSLPFELIGQNTAFLGLGHECIGNLHLTITPRRCLANDVENVRREYITPNDG